MTDGTRESVYMLYLELLSDLGGLALDNAPQEQISNVIVLIHAHEQLIRSWKDDEYPVRGDKGGRLNVPTNSHSR